MKKLSKLDLTFLLLCLTLFIYNCVKAQIKIMPLGDSITQGKLYMVEANSPLLKFNTGELCADGTEGSLNPGIGGYRLVLEQMLLDMGWDIEMVGQRTEGGGHHEGYPAYETSDIIQILPDILELNPPDVTLLHIGTNDLPEPVDADSCYKNILTILDMIHDFDNNIKVVLAQIIPCLQNTEYGQQRYPAIIELNNLLPNVLDGRSYVTLVDMWTPFVEYEEWETELMSGTWHPDDDGYYLMAEIWRDALQQIIYSRSPLITNILPGEGYIFESDFQCTIEGKYFKNGISFFLQREPDQQLPALSVIYESTNLVHANFDLTQGAQGQWQVVAVNPNKMRSIFSPNIHFSILLEAQTFVDSVRLNVGGGAYTDDEGNEWLVDRAYKEGGYGYVGGYLFSTNDPIAGTNNDPLYQTERWGLSAYRFDLPDGNYQVILHFAELYHTNYGMRIFDVIIEDSVVIDDYDIYNDVGHDVAVSKALQIDVTDGCLDVDMAASKDESKISAIEVITLFNEPLLSVTPVTLNFCGLTTNMTFNITNVGYDTLHWNVVEEPKVAWISAINPGAGSLSCGVSDTITITVDRASRKPGSYKGTISVLSNGGNQDIAVYMSKINSNRVQQVIYDENICYTNCEGDKNAGVEHRLIDIPKTLALSQNYPNPFNPVTTIELNLPFAATVKLNIFNMQGQHVHTVVNTKLAAGSHKIAWNATNASGNKLPSGVYLYNIEVIAANHKSFVITKKMLLMK